MQMNVQDEDLAVRRVRERLAARFPGVPEATVRAMVDAAHDRLVGPIRAFVPVLVEHEARDRLTRLSASAPPRDVERGGPTAWPVADPRA